MIDFYVKLLCASMLSGVIFIVMMKAQKRKEKAADDQYKLTLRSMGMSEHIIERHKPDVEVRDVPCNEVVLNKVVKITKKVPKRKVAKKKTNKKK